MEPSSKKPTISIIIPAYKHAPELPLCLESIFRQEFTDFEVIVVNDGSPDDTDGAVAPFRNRIIYIKQENRGGNAARNRGWNESKGDFVLFCDADVIMRPDMLVRMLEALRQNPEAAYAYSSFKFGWKKFRLWPFDAAKLREMNYIHTTSLIRREHFPGFDETIKRLQDWDLWLTMMERGHEGVWVPEYLFQCLPHKGGISLWVPKVFNAIPWRKFGIRMRNLEKLEEARRVMKEKHKLP